MRHFSYLSLYTVCRIFEKFGLRVWDVEQLSTHGGSLRVYGCHAEDLRSTNPSVGDLLDTERQKGLLDLNTYYLFQERANKIKDDLLIFLIEKKTAGKDGSRLWGGRQREHFAQLCGRETGSACFCL